MSVDAARAAIRSVQRGLVLFVGCLCMAFAMPVGAQNGTCPDYQPDVILRNYGEVSSVGNDIYNGLDGQVVMQEAPAGCAAVFYLKVENDGALNDCFLLTGPAGGPGWTAKYFNRYLGGDDVTAHVANSGLVTPVCEPGDSLRFRVEVTLDGTVPLDAEVICPITAHSTNSSTSYDVARVVTCKLPLQGVRLTVEPYCPGILGQPANLCAESLGGYQVQYRFFIYDGSSWTCVRPYDFDPVCATGCEKIGKYQLLVWAREVGSTRQWDCYDTQIFEVVPPPVCDLKLTADPSPTVIGRPFCLTADSACLGDVLYAFYVKTATGWSCVQPYSPDNTCDGMTTPGPGVFTFSVLAREVNSTKEFDAEAQVDVEVYPPLCSVTLETCPASPQTVGTRIGIRAVPHGGARVLYQLIIDGVARDGYTPQHEWVWYGNSMGAHTIRVNARELGSPNVYDCTAAINYSILGPESTVTLACAPGDVTAVGRPVSLRAFGQCPIPLEYRFFAYNGSGWTTIRPYSPDPVCAATPAGVGPCTFLVWARAIGSPQQYDCFATVDHLVTPPLTGVTLEGLPPSPVALGTEIHLRATPQGGGTVEYAYFLGQNGTWTPLRAYSQDPQLTTVADIAGNFRLAVWAREVGSPNEKDAWDEVSYTVTAPQALAALLTIEPGNTVAPGSSIRLVANCQAEAGAVLGYRFFAKNRNTGAFETIQPYGASNTCITTVPTTAGDYTFLVWVRDVRSNRQWDCFATVDCCVGIPPTGEPLCGVALNAAPGSSVSLGTPVTLTAAANGGTAVQYRFFVYDGSAWTTLNGYTSAKTYTITPPTAGLYKFVVWARDAGSTARWDCFAQCDVTVGPSVQPTTLSAVRLEANPANTTGVNQQIALRATPTGGTNVEYAFYESAVGGSWSLLRGYSTNPYFTTQWHIPGNYLFRVHAREVGSPNEFDVYAELPYTLTP